MMGPNACCPSLPHPGNNLTVTGKHVGRNGGKHGPRYYQVQPYMLCHVHHACDFGRGEADQVPRPLHCPQPHTEQLQILGRTLCSLRQHMQRKQIAR